MRRFSIALGLALLYAAAYYLPLLTPFSLYFVPSFFDFVLWPSLVSVIVLTPILYFASARLADSRWGRHLQFWGATALVIIAAKCVLDAAGYPWVKLLTALPSTITGAAQEMRWARIVFVGLVLGAALFFVYRIRQDVSKLLRFLSTLGYTFLLLAVYRCITADLIVPDTPGDGARATVAAASNVPTPRRVVWVIFDEMDYAMSMGPDAKRSQLPNFMRLGARSVSASNAYSPGMSTLYSIPSLLMGKPVSGYEVVPQIQVHLRDNEGKTLAFGVTDSLFEKLPGGPANASVLGFYHPYCKVLPGLQSCHSTYLGNAGRWFDSLVFFSETIFSALRHVKWCIQYMPEPLLFQFDPMYRASSNVLSRLDSTMANKNSSLDFIHLNLPHLPNVYVQRLLQQPTGNDKDGYAQNLIGADMVLARIIAELEVQAKQQEILLVVSSDHWLRSRSPLSERVPFMVWKVGDQTGHAVPQRFSTVHSAAIVIDFLNGNLHSQSDIADRMSKATFYETWIPPDDYRF